MAIRMTNKAGSVLAVLPYDTADGAAEAIAIALYALGSGYALGQSEDGKTAQVQVGHRFVYFEQIEGLDELGKAIASIEATSKKGRVKS